MSSPKPPEPPESLRGPVPRCGATSSDTTNWKEHEAGLLLTMCRTRDRLDELSAVVEAEGVVDPDTGRVHPCLVEHRQQAIAYARLTAALCLARWRRGRPGREPHAPTPDRCPRRVQVGGVVRSRTERPDVQAIYRQYDALWAEREELREHWSCPVGYWRRHNGCECDEHRRWAELEAETAQVYAETGVGQLDRLLATIGRDRPSRPCSSRAALMSRPYRRG